MALTVHLANYLAPEEAFHLARTNLPRGPHPAAHRHDFFELFWVEKGQVEHRLDSGVHRMDEGALAFIRPADCHALCAGPGGGTIINLAMRRGAVDYLAARYGGELGQKAFWSLQAQPHHVQLGQGQIRALRSSAAGLARARRSLLALDGFLLALFNLLENDEALPDGAQNGPAWLVESCRALARPQVLRGGARAFAAVSGLDRAHVSRVTRRYTGKTPSALILEARMALSAHLLAESRMPIAQVALEVGLENLSHFYAQFKKTHGTTPRAFAVRHRGGLGADLVGGRVPVIQDRQD
jgi:AraC family transcriptional regulator, dual regulator of chb operon